MIEVERRDVVRALAVVPFAGSLFVRHDRAVAADTSSGPLILFDPQLAPAQRFAERATALAGKPVALDGDRITFMRDLLASKPSAIFGVTRFADHYLISEIAREWGYRTTLLVRHKPDGSHESEFRGDLGTIAAVARLSGGRWPEAFAEIAIGGLDCCEKRSSTKPLEAAHSWLFRRAG